MKRIFYIALLFFCNVLVLNGQTSFKEQALSQFKAEHYHEAIATLKKALIDSPEDAELYYYLGFFSHYIGSDSRLFGGYDENYVEQILAYLDKAIELNPNYGDAKYFYGAECVTNAFVGMQNRDKGKILNFLERAYRKGAFPDWLIEFGRNILNSCEQNAILFTAGDADFNVCLYLQVIEKFRTDITLIPIGNIDRSWYIKYIKDGFDGITPAVNIGLSDNQIMQIRPFKWKTTPINIDISNADRVKYHLSSDYKMVCSIFPDYYSNRMHSKIEIEEEQKRTYLSPQRGMLLQIVEKNMATRPIFFTNFSEPTFYGGFQDYFQNFGLVSKLTPLETKGTVYENSYEDIEKVLKKENLLKFPSIVNSDIPRISNVVLIYYYLVDLLSEQYEKEANLRKLSDLENIFNASLLINFNLKLEDQTKKIFSKEGKE